MNTRNGKIARLPRGVRNELNQRLDDGERGARLLAWLNGLPAVKRVLAECFGGRDINDQNLSDWKAGGFQDWLAHREALDQARVLNENTGELAATVIGPWVDNLATVLGLRTAAVLAEWPGEVTEEYERKLGALRKLSLLVMGLRRNHHAAMRMEMELIEIKTGINDQIRKTHDDEFAPEPEDELYEHLWRMSGHKFGDMELAEEVAGDTNQDEDGGLRMAEGGEGVEELEGSRVKEEEERKKDGTKTFNNQQPTPNIEHRTSDDGAGGDEGEPEAERFKPIQGNSRRASGGGEVKDEGAEHSTLDIEHLTSKDEGQVGRKGLKS